MQATSSTLSSNDQSTVDAKILADLNVLKEKMDLCENILRPGDGSPPLSLKDDTMLTVIGFLEACAPRMVELVEAGAQGSLGEAVLMECLTVNDRLTKLLEDIDTYAETETTASTTAASAPPRKTSIEEHLDNLLLEDFPAAAATPSTGKTNGEDDPFASPSGKTTGVVDDPVAALPTGSTTGVDDPFSNQVLAPSPAAGKTTEDDPFAADVLTPAAPPPAAAPPQPTDDFDAFLEERTSK